MRTLPTLTLVGVLAIAAGCATTSSRMSATDCDNADWRALGLEDGLEGAHSTRLEQRQQQCTDANVVPDAVAYAEGYEEGLATFCQPRGGYEYGLEGKDYAWVCSRDTEPDFIQGYQLGFREYELIQALRDADRNLDRMERDMRNTQNDVQRLQSQYNNSANNSNSERMRMQTEVDRLRRRVFELQQERNVFRSQRNQAEKQLSEFRKNRPPIEGVD